MLLRVIITLCFGFATSQERGFDAAVPGFVDLDYGEQTSEKCPTVTVMETGCFDCFRCNDRVISSHKNNLNKIYVFPTKSNACAEETVCCVSQKNLTHAPRGECGLNNPLGSPQAERSSPRSVLRGEYPWRARVFSRNRKILCSASLINRDVRALLVPASCVAGLAAGDLSVVPESGGSSTVSEIIVHDAYDSGTGKDDIAIIVIDKLERLKPVCMPIQVTRKECFTVSASEEHVNMDTPRACPGSVDDSTLMCSAAPREENTELGAGVYCLFDPVNQGDEYVISGMMRKPPASGETLAAHKITNVTHYSDWIFDKLHKLKQ